MRALDIHNPSDIHILEFLSILVIDGLEIRTSCFLLYCIVVRLFVEIAKMKRQNLFLGKGFILYLPQVSLVFRFIRKVSLSCEEGHVIRIIVFSKFVGVVVAIRCVLCLIQVAGKKSEKVVLWEGDTYRNSGGVCSHPTSMLTPGSGQDGQ